MEQNHKEDPLHPHVHEPNPVPPSPEPDFVLSLPDGRRRTVTLSYLRSLPSTRLPDCYIVSTGHGTSGPFIFTGVPLLDLLRAQAVSMEGWRQVEVISADGFGTRVMVEELYHPGEAGPILLAHTLDGLPMSREQGLVRLIVPSERDDALRQVKWVGQINLRA